jgi:hypothetical protein
MSGSSESVKPFTSVRWWENYLVRYFVGTAVGAAIIIILLDSSLSSFKSIVFSSSTKDSTVKDVNPWVLVAGGLAYCYFASAPMLTLHATRAQLGLVEMRHRWNRVVVLISTIVTLTLGFKFLFKVEWTTIGALELLLFSVIFGTQIVLLIEAHRQSFRPIQLFYENLSQQRSAGADDLKTSEYIESYRHLREHANAYAIIVLELVLALVLSAVHADWQKVTVLLLWVAPSGYCWLIATVLEARFAARGKSGTSGT